MDYILCKNGLLLGMLLRQIFGWHFEHVLGEQIEIIWFLILNKALLHKYKMIVNAKVEATHLTSHFKLYIASHYLCFLFHHSLSLGKVVHIQCDMVYF